MSAVTWAIQSHWNYSISAGTLEPGTGCGHPWGWPARVPGTLNVAQDREEQHMAVSAGTSNSDSQQRMVWEERVTWRGEAWQTRLHQGTMVSTNSDRSRQRQASRWDVMSRALHLCGPPPKPRASSPPWEVIMLIPMEGHPAKCLTSPPQNCQGHQGKSEKLSQPTGDLRGHDDQTLCGVLNGILDRKRTLYKN